jgi:hypothetical protein
MANQSGNTWSFDILAQDWDALKGKTLYYRTRVTDVAGNEEITERDELIDSINDAPEITSFSPIDLAPVIDPGTCQAFSITASDDDQDVLSYEWWLDNVQVGSSSSYNYCPLESDVGVHSLVGLVSDGSLFDSQSWEVNVGANNPPIIPNNPTPADNATGVSITADLSWTGGDPDSGDTVTYDIYFEAGDNTPDQLLCNDVSSTT